MKMQEYEQLLTMNYSELVDHLLKKYGPGRDDYFKENSYNRFMNGEIKIITKGKYSRTLEGLYAHHIDEDKYLKISDQNFIKKYKYPFELQKANRLIYCDLIEHTILHAIISKETDGEFGFLGYDIYLRPMFEDWYLTQNRPQKSKWHQNCYDKSYIPQSLAMELLKKIEEILPLTLQHDYRNKIAKQRLLEYQKARKDDIASQNNEITENQTKEAFHI
ncbi:hypothetical protein ACRCJS_09030 [Aerococcus urinaeequi]|uniref:hypothetical protein n=1 Tax=Aerococcus urinaeequi TaxID=51665 RepID=UPI003D6BD7AA